MSGEENAPTRSESTLRGGGGERAWDRGSRSTRTHASQDAQAQALHRHTHAEHKHEHEQKHAPRGRHRGHRGGACPSAPAPLPPSDTPPPPRSSDPTSDPSSVLRTATRRQGGTQWHRSRAAERMAFAVQRVASQRAIA
eukprot:3409532-Rhodomonas_salina.1